jgi:hypothetical protein
MTTRLPPVSGKPFHSRILRDPGLHRCGRDSGHRKGRACARGGVDTFPGAREPRGESHLQVETDAAFGWLLADGLGQPGLDGHGFVYDAAIRQNGRSGVSLPHVILPQCSLNEERKSVLVVTNG